MPEIDIVLPLTPAQRGLLPHSVAGAERGLYVNQVVFRLDGELRPRTLRECWERLVARHEALRSCFLWQDLNEPVQVILPAAGLPWTDLDWSGLPSAEREIQLSQLLAAERAKPFALAQPPLLRFTLIDVGDDGWWLLWTVHHLVIDGWSMGVAVEEVLANYHGVLDGNAVAVPQPAPRYRDYVDWLGRQDLAECEQYWRRTLAGRTEDTPAPGTRSVPSGARTSSTYKEELGRQESDALRDYCRANRLTLGTLVHSAWAVVVSRHARQPDVVFGSVTSGRPAGLTGAGATVGLFAATLPVRAAVDEEAEAASWFADLQSAMAEARQYEYAPLSRIAAWADVSDASRLISTVVAWENYPYSDTDDASCSLRLSRVDAYERSHFPARLVASGEDRITLCLHVDDAWYETADARSLLGHVRAFLANLAIEQPLRLADISLLPRRERALVEQQWPLGASAPQAAATLPELFQAQVRRTPDRLALAYRDEILTYRELAAEVDRLSRHLRQLGVGPEAAVAVCMRPCLDLVVAIYAVISAGGVLVPLDPAVSPAPRIQTVVRNARCALLLTSMADSEAMPEIQDCAVLTVDDPEVRAAVREQPAESLPGGLLSPDNAMYVMHTSGSTGTPKGVVVTHRSVLGYLASLQAALPLSPSDLVAQRTSVGFDISIRELYWPLLNGAGLLLLEAPATDPERMAAEMDAHAATVVSYVPSLLEGILAEPERRLPRRVRLMLIGGEALSSATVRRLRAHYGGVAVNGYGPTEITVACALWRIPEDGAGERPPIGRPLDNAICRPLDARLRPVPPGITGELLVGGTGVARGYLDQPGLTAERFIPDPYGPPGSRLYRTGDLVRWLPGGDLDYLGRDDLQVKVNGFRIELGEIERVLERHPGIARAVVIAREGSTGMRLAAYATCTGKEQVTVPDLRAWLGGRLPGYMVPANFVFLECFPLTGSGKVDRKALPDREPALPEASAIATPGTPAERVLAAVWCDVLGLDRVGLQENFFELGGDSIISLAVVSRARRAGLSVTPQQVLTRQTVAELAQEAEWVAAPPRANGNATLTGPVMLSPVQHWFFGQGFARPGHWNLNLEFAVTIRDPGERARLADRVNAVLGAAIARHDALRTRFLRDAGGRWSAELLPPSQVPPGLALSVVEVDKRQDWPRTLTQAAEAAQEFDLGRAPLLRAVLVDGGRADRVRLLLIGHHLVVDAVSWRVLLDDLAAGFTDLLGSRPVRLPEPTTPSGQWARILNERATHPEVAAQLDYWRAQLADVGLLPDVPAAPARSLEGDVRRVHVELSAERTGQLLKDVARTFHTELDDALLAALTLALGERTGRAEAVFAVETHGREQHLAENADLSGTVGWFTAISPLRLRLPEAADPAEALLEVKRSRREIPNRGLDYGLLRYLHAAGRTHLAAAPQPQVSYNNLGRIDDLLAQDAEGIRLRPAPEAGVPTHHRENPRPYLLEVVAAVRVGHLCLTFSYCPTHHRESTVRGIADAVVRHLDQLITHSLGRDGTVALASDFPGSGLDQSQLDALMSALD